MFRLQASLILIQIIIVSEVSPKMLYQQESPHWFLWAAPVPHDLIGERYFFLAYPFRVS